MIELRQVNCGDGSFRLEQRTRSVTCDASGAFAGFTEWSEWGPVPTVGITHGPNTLTVGRWIACSDRLPSESGSYPIFALSEAQDSPLRTTAWFEPDGTGNKPGWQLLPEVWCNAITHWMQWPDDPRFDNSNFQEQ